MYIYILFITKIKENYTVYYPHFSVTQTHMKLYFRIEYQV